MMKHVRLLAALLMTASTIGAVGMVQAPAAAQVYGGIGIRIGPPPPRYEPIPVARPGYVWRRGYWHWNGERYVWYRGAYGVRPYAGAVWVPGHYVSRHGNWFWRPGHWS